MFCTITYRHGWIQESHYPGCRPVYAARSPGRCLGDYTSAQAAKLAITRDAKVRAAEIARAATEHHAQCFGRA